MQEYAIFYRSFGRQWAFNSLGKYWSVDIEIRDNHELIKNGPYKYMRHPNNVFTYLKY